MSERFWTPRRFGPWVILVVAVAVLSVAGWEVPGAAPLVRRALQVLGTVLWVFACFGANDLGRCGWRRLKARRAPPPT